MLHVKYPHQRMLLNSQRFFAANSAELFAAKEKMERYKNFLVDFQTHMSLNDFSEMTQVLNEYMDYAKDYEFCPGGIYPTRTKYYSSILEELPVHLVKNTIDEYIASHPAMGQQDMYLGNNQCVIRVGVSTEGEFFSETKQMDFALALKKTFFGQDVYVPLLGLEVKRYMDKTMFHTVEHTSRVLSEFRPRTYYGVVIEDESRAKDVVCNSVMYEREFILTGKGRPKNDKLRNPIEESRLEQLSTRLKAVVDVCLKETFSHLNVSKLQVPPTPVQVSP